MYDTHLCQDMGSLISGPRDNSIPNFISVTISKDSRDDYFTGTIHAGWRNTSLLYSDKFSAKQIVIIVNDVTLNPTDQYDLPIYPMEGQKKEAPCR